MIRSGHRLPVRSGVKVIAVVLVGLISLPVGGQETESNPTADGPGQTLELFGLDESTLRQFTDNSPLIVDEYEPIYRLLYLFPRFERVDLHRWSTPLGDGVELVSDPAASRGEIFSLQGWVEDIQTVELPPESVRRFNYDRFYLLRVKSSSEGRRSVLVCSREIPAAWKKPEAAGRSFAASCLGMFVKVGAFPSDVDDPAPEELVFVTDHIAWHPFSVDEELGVNAGKALLGQFGMDVSLFAYLEQGKPIGHSDRDCFYQLLWVMGRLDPAAIRTISHPNFQIAEWLKQPQQQGGKFFRLKGLARRALKIRVEGTDIQENYGLDHYYEVDMFLPLPRTLRLVDPRDQVAREYQTYPVTLCVRDLPEGMPEGSSIRQEISVDTCFMKLWSYRSQFMTGEDTPEDMVRRQVSPLFVARTVTKVEPSQEKIVWPETALVIGFFFSLGVIGISAWYYARTDRAFVDWRRRRRSQLPDELKNLE